MLTFQILVWPRGTCVKEKRFEVDIQYDEVLCLKQELALVGGLYGDSPDCVPCHKMELVHGGVVMIDGRTVTSYFAQHSHLPRRVFLFIKGSAKRRLVRPRLC